MPSGELDLKDETFREMARAYPAQIGPIRELRYALSQMRLNELAVGADGRNRVLLSAYSSRTSRNQPSNSRFIFGPAVWLRSLIRPSEGMALARLQPIRGSVHPPAIAHSGRSGPEPAKKTYIFRMTERGSRQSVQD